MRRIDTLYAALSDELSGPRALDTATAIARYDRMIGSRDYTAAVDLLAAKLQDGGADEVAIERFPIDGVSQYMDRTYAPAYEPHAARLQVIEPTTYAICDYAETPMCLPTGTPATPPEGIIAELIDVGRGDQASDYTELDVAGKAVLATGATTEVYNLAVGQHGAGCVLTTNLYTWSDLPERKRSLMDLPDATHLARLYYSAEIRRDAPAFSITYRHARQLRAQMAQGPVKIQAFVEAENKPGEMLVLNATIAGTDLADEEVWILAHLCHPKPGACDNGSGVALGVEVFRAIANLIRRRKLGRPRRTLRLLLLPEVSGTQAYMDRFASRMDKVEAGINLDMVGANYALTGAYLRLLQTPWSRPSYLNHLGGYLLEKTSLGSRSHIRSEPVRDWLYSLAPYDKGSDHDVLLNSGYAIPSVFFFNWPHRYYHTDLDTPEKLDAAEFARTGLIAGTMALVAAGLDAEMAQQLLSLLQAEAAIGLARQSGYRAPELVDGAEDSDVARLAAYAVMEHGALESVSAALPATEREQTVVTLAHANQAIAPWLSSESAPHSCDGDQRVPVRLGVWPVNMGQFKAEDDTALIASLRDAVVDFDDKAVAALNYVNGERTVATIARLVTGELGALGTKYTLMWFELLAKYNMIGWRGQ